MPFPSAEEDGPTPDLPQNPVAQNPVESTATGTSGDRVEPGAMMNTESRKQAVSTHSSVYPLLGSNNSYESLNSPPTQPHHFFITQTEGVSITFLYRLEPPPLPNSRDLDVQDPVNSSPDPELQDSQSHTEENPAAVREEMCLDKVMETRVTLQQEEEGEDTSRNAGASTAEEKQNEQHSVSGAQSPETRSHVIADTAESDARLPFDTADTGKHPTTDSLESQTAPHSTTDSLESQTAPHSTTDSLESQTAPHSTTDSLESQTAPTLGQQIGQQEPAQTSPQDQRSLQAVTTGKQNDCTIREYSQRKQSNRTAMMNKRSKSASIESAISAFHAEMKFGPDFVCTCCHRIMYRKSVILCNRANYTKASSDVLLVVFSPNLSYISPDGKEWVCRTCDRTLKRGNMPLQAKANGLQLCPVPPELSGLNALELRLICLRVPFMKMVALPTGKQRSIHGPAVNVPSKVDTICEVLPGLPSQTEMVPLKLKRKVAYRGHYMYDYVTTQKPLDALRFLKTNNPLYCDIEINDQWLLLMMMSLVCV